MGIKAPLPGIATPATNERSKSISPYLIARSLQEESVRSATNAANNLISIDYSKRFRGVMPISGGLGASSFKGINIIKFFKRYKKLGANFGLSKPEVMKRVSQYCEIIIGQFIKNLLEYEKDIWKNFKKVLLKTFKEHNSY